MSLKKKNMTEIEAIAARHSVRKYIDKPLEVSTVAALRSKIEEVNAAGGLHVQLVLDEPKCFSAGLLKYGSFSGVKNYLVMAASAGKEEEIGYYGESLVLLAQTLGLNSCWVGLTYKKIPGTFTLNEGESVYCVIALGYGEHGGVQHPLKAVEKFYDVPSGSAVPDWFKAGMDAALLAPTAINQQKFHFTLLPDGKVEAKAGSSLAGYTKIDLGIAKYHFEVGAGKEHFSFYNPQ